MNAAANNIRPAIAAATLTTPNMDASLEAWALLGYHPIAAGVVDDRLANHWGAPAAGGRPMAMLAPETGDGYILRLVAGHCPKDYRPHRHSGWLALEMTVADVYQLEKELEGSPFERMFPPQQLQLEITDCIHAMQSRGPAGEVLYLTTIGEQVPGLTAPVAEARVDRAFAAVAGSGTLADMCTFYHRHLGAVAADPVPVRIRTTSSAWNMPEDSEFLLSVAPIGATSLLELDEMPAAAAPAAFASGDLPPGVCIYSFRVASLQDAGIGEQQQTEGPAGAPYFGGPTGMLRGVGGEWIELIGDGGPLK